MKGAILAELFETCKSTFSMLTFKYSHVHVCRLHTLLHSFDMTENLTESSLEITFVSLQVFNKKMPPNPEDQLLFSVPMIETNGFYTRSSSRSACQLSNSICQSQYSREHLYAADDDSVLLVQKVINNDCFLMAGILERLKIFRELGNCLNRNVSVLQLFKAELK